LALWVLQVLSVFIGLWILNRTRIGERWRSPSSQQRFQFSIMHLLALMTVTAVLLVAVRLANFDNLGVIVVMFATNNAALAIAAVLSHSLRVHFILGWAAFAGVAVISTYALMFLVNDDGATGINAYQALVLFLWLTIGGIGPSRARDIDAESPAQPPLESST
jgi:hypothetical protein